MLSVARARPARPHTRSVPLSQGDRRGWWPATAAVALATLDRQLLHPALAKLLKDPSGRTRGTAAYSFTLFTRDDLAGGCVADPKVLPVAVARGPVRVKRRSKDTRCGTASTSMPRCRSCQELTTTS